MWGHHILEIWRAGRSADDGRAEEAISRAGELLANVVPQQLEITHLSGDTVTVAPCCAGRVRLNDRRSRVWGREGSLLLEFVEERRTLVVVVVVMVAVVVVVVVL